jgi:ATP-dependent helicase/nuclease subunit B
MPETIFLTEREPVVFKAARWLAALSSERPLDLGHCAVLVPTSGAGRRLRSELVRLAGEGGSGLLPPLLTTPMGLLALATREKVAGRIDVLLAWTEVISNVSVEQFPLLLSGLSDHRNSAFQIGQSLMELCSLLAEAGLTPLSPEIADRFPSQEDRWQELQSLYQKYLNCQADAGLADPNAARIRAARTGVAPENIRRVIVAGVPDLNRISQDYLRSLESAGVSVAVLVDAPDCEGARFDGWGRPDPETWPQSLLPLRLEDFAVMADPWSEAEVIASLIGPAGAGLCVADAQIIPFVDRAMRKQGLATYDPAGKPLAPFECATLSRLWLSFASSGRIGELRTLAEHPVFLRLLCRESRLQPTAALSSLDELQTKILAETVSDAAAYFDEAAPDSHGSRTAALVAAAEGLRRKFGVSGSLGDLLAFLRAVYSARQIVRGSAEAEALVALSGLLHAVLDSPLSKPDIDEGIFCEEMKNVAVFEHHRETDIELNGWLEAHWLPDAALIVAGCTEGALPARISSHPFLPDSVRVALGLYNNVQRFARDTYLLHCLLATRNPGAVKLTLCRLGADGEPAKPSRLLFRCPDADLGSRVRKVFGSVDSLRTFHARERTWLIEIPQCPPPSTLRVTAFGDYLKCPLRFYLKHVLGMRKFDSPKTEMDALDFGSVFHKTLENFARQESIRESSNPAEIEGFVVAEADAILVERFGRRLSLPLRVQRESLRARLRQFARIQAQERRAGWRIHRGELRFETEHTLALAGLPVVGVLDRVDIHEETGRRRILDYKTFARRKSATNSHLEFVSEMHELWGTIFDGKTARWCDLQLPLYRALAEFLWPGERLPPLVGYFLLPERIEESGIDEFALDEALFASAMSSAGTVADRVRRGIFWPPGVVQYDDFTDIFLGEDPATIVSEKSRDFLMGAQEFHATR